MKMNNLSTATELNAEFERFSKSMMGASQTAQRVNRISAQVEVDHSGQPKEVRQKIVAYRLHSRGHSRPALA
jgi:flagellar hook assembly protein FlgD